MRVKKPKASTTSKERIFAPRRLLIFSTAMATTLLLTLGAAAPAQAAAKIAYPSNYTFTKAAVDGSSKTSATIASGKVIGLHATLKLSAPKGHKVSARVSLQRKIASGKWTTIKNGLKANSKKIVKASTKKYSTTKASLKVYYRFKSSAYKASGKRGVPATKYSKTLTITYKYTAPATPAPTPTSPTTPTGPTAPEPAGPTAEPVWDTEYSFGQAYIDGSGSDSSSTVGNGGQLNLETGLASSYYEGHEVAPKLALQQKLPNQAWRTIQDGLSLDSSNGVEVFSPAYSASSSSEIIEYRFVSSAYTTADGDGVSQTTYSPTLAITYENQSFYTGMQKEAYVTVQPFCPNTAIHVVAPEGSEAGMYNTGALVIKISPSVSGYETESRQSVYLHECAHERQFINWGSTYEGRMAMEQAMAQYFVNDSSASSPPASSPFEPVEHAADCASRAIQPKGYLGYGGYCNPQELARGEALIRGQRL